MIQLIAIIRFLELDYGINLSPYCDNMSAFAFIGEHHLKQCMYLQL